MKPITGDYAKIDTFNESYKIIFSKFKQVKTNYHMKTLMNKFKIQENGL